MIAIRCRIQDQHGPVADLRPERQDSRVVALGRRIPGHDRDVLRRGTGLGHGARPERHLAQDRGDALVGEAEADPDHRPAIDEPPQHPAQLALVGAPVLGRREHHGIGLVVVTVGKQHRQFRLAEHPSGPPAVQPELVVPGSKARYREPGPHAQPRVDNAGVVVGRDDALEGTPAHQFMHRRPGPAGRRVGTRQQRGTQDLPVGSRAQPAAQDFDDLLGAVHREGPACRRLLLGQPVRRRVHQLPDQPRPKRIQGHGGTGAEERQCVTRAQVLAQFRESRLIDPGQGRPLAFRQSAQVAGPSVVPHG